MASQAEKMDVVVIGAGWQGLVAARTYLRLRPSANLLIIDSESTVGGVWSKERLYPNLVAQVKLGLFNYSDTPMPPGPGDATHTRVSGEMIHGYLQKYAEDHGLLRHIRFNTFVKHVEQCPQGWRLTFRDSDDVVEAEKLLVATGTSSIEQMPTFDDEDSSAPIIHSRDLGVSFEALKDEKIESVVVVGAAKSAYDAVYLLLTMVLNMLNPIAAASTRLMTYLSPSIMNTHGSLYWFFQRSSVGRWCTRRFWDFLSYVSGVHAGYASGDQVSMLRPEIENRSIFWAHSGLGVVTMPDFWKTLHSPNLTIVRDEIEAIKMKTVHLKSNTTFQTDFAIMCTGWGDHFAMFDADLKAKIGLPAFGDDTYSIADDLKTTTGPDWASYDAAAEQTICEKLPLLAQSPNQKHPNLLDPRRQKKWRLYRRMVPVELAENGDRSIAILGQIHTIQTPIVSEVQALWSTLYLLGEIDLPSVDSMATEISVWNAWTRKRYLNQGQKFCCSYYDFLSYVDGILEDLGIRSRRKSNFISEICSPYQPSDFKGFVDEYLAKRELLQEDKKLR
ncbi:hypothetical protein MBLNU459_g3842t1 [Dothideomycetes sp. NU459]